MKEIECGKSEYDASSRRCGKSGTRETFMNAAMEIDKRFKFESQEPDC